MKHEVRLASAAAILLLAGCDATTGFRLDMLAGEFRTTCTGAYTANCVDLRVDHNVLALENAIEKAEEERDTTFAALSDEEFEAGIAALRHGIELNEDDRPNVVSRWFFGDDRPWSQPKLMDALITFEEIQYAFLGAVLEQRERMGKPVDHLYAILNGDDAGIVADGAGSDVQQQGSADVLAAEETTRAASGIAADAEQAPDAPQPPASSIPVDAPQGTFALDFGLQLGEDGRVAESRNVFAAGDTVYGVADIPSAGMMARVTAEWRKGNDEIIGTDQAILTTGGPIVQSFRISRPEGWTTGRYKLIVLVEGDGVQVAEFWVQ